MYRGRVVPALAGLWVFLAAAGGYAQVTVLQNDSYTSGSVFTCVSGFVQDETMAARFTAPPGAYPYVIDRIRVLACGGEAAYGVTVWQDNGTLNPGAVLWQSDEFVAMGGSDAFYEVVPSSPVVVNAGTVRVGLTQVLPLSGSPGFGRDGNGIVAQRNLIHAKIGASLVWSYAETLLVRGDFILRLHIIPDVLFKDGFETALAS
jgi:hypothetical protein